MSERQYQEKVAEIAQLLSERDEAREQAQRLRVQLNHYTQANEMAEQAFRERDEARTVLERIVKLSINARRVEEDYVEWEKALLAILDICEERKEK